MRKEKEIIKGITLSGAEWRAEILNFLNHIITLQTYAQAY